jgi:hypothetical protein
MGLPRVIEAEPDAAEALLEMLCTKRRPDVAEAAAALFADLSSPSFGRRSAKVLKQTLAQRVDSQNSVLRSVAERAVRILDRDQDEQNEVVASVRRALLAYESKGRAPRPIWRFKPSPPRIARWTSWTRTIRTTNRCCRTCSGR